MFTTKKEDSRFIVEKARGDTHVSCYILTDKETGVLYLSNWMGSGGGITPLLDQNGNVSKVDVRHLDNL